ncbi:MAG: NTP transferase domain-containing protein [Halobacteriaceae archaeon]
MAGGRGTRLDADREKPLVRVGDAPMVDRVRAALAAADVDAVHAVCSPHAPDTRAHLAAADVDVVDAPGEGYVADLSAALETVGRPALTVAADLPLLDGAAVDRVLEAAGGDTLTVVVPSSLKRSLGASVDGSGRRVPAGVNVVGEGADRTWTVTDPRFAVNVNRPADVAVAESLLSRADSSE